MTAKLEQEAYEGELEELRRLKNMIRHEALAEKFGDIYFICGEGGEKDKNNLPKQIFICPAYGVDWFQVYERQVTKGSSLVGNHD
jgi:hypothetical protein